MTNDEELNNYINITCKDIFKTVDDAFYFKIKYKPYQVSNTPNKTIECLLSRAINARKQMLDIVHNTEYLIMHSYLPEKQIMRLKEIKERAWEVYFTCCDLMCYLCDRHHMIYKEDICKYSNIIFRTCGKQMYVLNEFQNECE